MSVVLEEASGREKKICELVQARPVGGGGGHTTPSGNLRRQGTNASSVGSTTATRGGNVGRLSAKK